MVEAFGIVTKSEEHAPFPAARRDWVHAAAATLLSFALYAATACRTFYVGDSAEIAAATAVFGVPHPPGYPLFTLLTGAIVHVVPGDPAFAANLVTGGWGALAVGALGLAARRFGASIVASWVAVAGFALGRTWWSQCVAAEVYSFDTLLLLLTFHAALGLGPPRVRTLWLALAVGLWIGNRLVNVLYLPALLVIACDAGFVPSVLRSKLLVAGLGLAVLPFLYLPFASVRDPAVNIGDPETWDRFWTVVRSAPYVRHWFGSSLGVSLGRVIRHLEALPVELGVSAPLALIGLAGLASQRRFRLFAALLALIAINFFVCAAYAVLDIDVFFIPSTVALCLLSAFGLDEILVRVNKPLRIAFAAAPLGLLFVNFGIDDLRRHTVARRLTEDTLESVPIGGLLLVSGDTSIHGLWYLQGVEKKRPDVILVSPGHIAPWYVSELRGRYPDEQWPEEVPEEPVPYVRALLESFVGHREIYATPSVDLSAYGAAGPGARFGSLPRGLVSRVAPVGTAIDLKELGDWTSLFFDRAFAQLVPIPRRPAPDDASTYLVYALSAVQSADLFASTPERELAASLYRRARSLAPDDLELIESEDVKQGLGERIPGLALEARIAAGLEQMSLATSGQGGP